MSSVVLKPLLSPRTISKDPINPNEFWPAFPSIAKKTEELFGSLQARNRIPIFPIEDLADKLQTKWCCLNSISTLDHPIEIYFFTNKKGISGISIVYRIKSIQKSKFTCLRTKIQRSIEMLNLVSPENSKKIGRVITTFEPASASDSLLLPFLHKLFTEGEYQEKRSALSECFSLYRSQRVILDEQTSSDVI